MGAPPEKNTTSVLLGVSILSLAVKVKVTSLPTFARLVVELFEAIPTLFSDGAVLSIVTLPLPLVTGVPEFSARSLNVTVYPTAPPVSPAITVYFAVWVLPELS